MYNNIFLKDHTLFLLRMKIISILIICQVNQMSEIYDNVWETRKHKPPKKEEIKLIEPKMPSSDHDRLKDSIERRRKSYGLK